MQLRGKLAAVIGTAITAALICAPLSLPANAATHPRPGGGLVLPATTSNARLILGAGSGSSLPDSVDLRQWAPPAGDQSYLNSCVSWAIGHTILGWYSRKMGTPTTFAPMYIYSQSHLTNSMDGGGSYVRDALNVVNSQGIDTAADYQPQGDYNFTDLPTAAQRTNAAPYVTLDAQRLFASSFGQQGYAAQLGIQNSIAAGKPVGLAIPIYEQLYYLDANNYNFDNSKVSGSNYGYHYLAVLGYDTTGVIVENSWGTWWGQNGFAHLGWDFVQQYAVEAESYSGFAASSLPAGGADPVATPTATPTTEPTTPVTTTPVVDTPTTTPTTPVITEPTTTPTTTPTTPITTEPTTTPTTPVVTPSQEPTTPVTIPTTPTSTPTTPVTTVNPPTITNPVTIPSIQDPAPVKTQEPVTTPTTPVVVTPPSTTKPVTPPTNDAAPQPNIPTRVVSIPDTRSTNLAWRAVTGASSYNVTVKGKNVNRTLTTNSTKLNVTGLAPYTTYTLTVRARTTAGLTQASTVTVRTAGLKPTIKTLKAKLNAAKRTYSLAWNTKIVSSGNLQKYTVVTKLGKKTVNTKTVTRSSTHAATVKLPKRGTYTVTFTVYTTAKQKATKTVRIALR